MRIENSEYTGNLPRSLDLEAFYNKYIVNTDYIAIYRQTWFVRIRIALAMTKVYKSVDTICA